MKKMLSAAVVLGLSLSLTAGASAEPASDVVFQEPFTPDKLIVTESRMIDLPKVTYFYDMPDGKPMGAVAPQLIDTTGQEFLVSPDGDWVEIYTWMGKYWIKIPKGM